MNGNLITNNSFGERLYALRTKAGYRVPRELALALCGLPKNKTGLTVEQEKVVARMRRNIENWELGKNIPRAALIATLCNLLDCDPNHLLYEEAISPRKKAETISQATGLSAQATEALLGIHKYGPTNALNALDAILRYEQMWNFLSRKEENVSGINLLWHIGRYLSDDRAESHYLVYIDKKEGYPNNRVEISANNYINHGEPLAALYDRAILDTINDGLKEMRKEKAKTATKPTPTL